MRASSLWALRHEVVGGESPSGFLPGWISFTLSSVATNASFYSSRVCLPQFRIVRLPATGRSGVEVVDALLDRAGEQHLRLHELAGLLRILDGDLGKPRLVAPRNFLDALGVRCSWHSVVGDETEAEQRKAEAAQGQQLPAAGRCRARSPPIGMAVAADHVDRAAQQRRALGRAVEAHDIELLPSGYC